MNTEILEKVAKVHVNLNFDSIIERLHDKYRWPIQYSDGLNSVEMINSNQEKETNFYDEEGYIISQKVIDLYNEGYTFILSKCQYLFNDVKIISDILSEFYGFQIQSNIYFSKGIKSISFPTHSHSYDVLVKNVCGKSLWKIENKEEILESMDVFFLERKTKHEVIKIYEPKISITYNLCRFKDPNYKEFD
jgi:hypothetical protein